MAISHHSVELTTTVGVIDANVQDARTVYVRAGRADVVLAAARAPLVLGPGSAQLSFRGHFKLRAGEWTCSQPFVSRVDQRRDRQPTRKMIDRAVSAIAEQLAEYHGAHADVFDRAQRTVGAALALDRTAIAVRLRQLADQLDAEAAELLAGGRETYWSRVLAGSYSETIARVERADGTLMDPCPTAPAIHGATNYPCATIQHEREVD